MDRRAKQKREGEGKETGIIESVLVSSLLVRVFTHFLEGDQQTLNTYHHKKPHQCCCTHSAEREGMHINKNTEFGGIMCPFLKGLAGNNQSTDKKKQK